MFSKFSVRKPYTVIVGVILVLILGFISFTESTTDLLPEMELPYVVVYSTYPGASAEKVESNLTRVLEGAIGTTENLENMNSVSSDNLSLLILEFADDTNMDTAMIDLNAKIDLVEGSLDDMCSTPVLLQLNPNMLPVMMVTVDSENMDLQELSDFVNETLITELEKTSGVASVDPSGLLKETVRITLDQDKVEDINNKILASVDSELAKTERELRQNLRKVNDGLAEIEKAEKELGETKTQTFSNLGDTTVQLQQAAMNFIAMDSEVTQLNAEKMAFQQIVNAVEMIKTQLGLPDDASQEEIQTAVDNTITTLNTTIATLTQTKESLEQASAMFDYLDDSMTLQMVIMGMQMQGMDTTEIEGMMAQMGLSGANTVADLKTAINASITTLDENITTMEQTVAQLSMASDAINIYDDSKTKLNIVEVEIVTAQTVKDTASAFLQQAGIDISDIGKLQSQLDSGKLIAVNQMTLGEFTVSQTKTSLQSAKAQLEDGLKKLEDARDEALKAANISGVLNSQMISTILTAENFSMPAGYIGSDDESLLIKVGEEFATLEEVENLLLVSMDIKGLEAVKLKDIATVEIIDNHESLYTKINGNDGVMISFQKTSTASTTEVCNNLKKTFDNLENEYDGLRFTPLMDQGVYIDLVISSVLQNFGYGAILAIIVLILFLKDVKPTFVIALSIPISLMFSLVLMYFSDITLNIMSLAGLALGVGMLVDNSVVVVENIYRLRSEGMGIIKASIQGAKQVSGAIIASTLTTVCVFLPLVFADGLAKQLFVDMGLTIAFSLFASLIIALTLVPMLASKMLKKQKEQKASFLTMLTNGYGKLLELSLNLKYFVLAGVVALLLFSVFEVTRMPMSLIPSMSSGQMSLSVSLVDEEATTEEKHEVFDEIMNRVKVLDGVETIGVTGSGGGLLSMAGGSGGSTTFYIITDEKANTEKLSEEMAEVLKDLPIHSNVSSSTMDISALSASGVSITLYGSNLDHLKEGASIIAKQLEEVEGVSRVSDGNDDPTKELRVIVDKNAAMEYGLTVAQIYQKVASGVSDETTSTTLTLDDKDYPVIIIDSSHLIDANNIYYTDLDGTKNQESTTVQLNKIAHVEEATGMNSIRRENSQRFMTVTASIADGYNVALVSRDVEKAIDESALPKGVTLAYNGENETIMETMFTLVKMIALAIAFIYMIMVAQFESLLSPFIVLFTIPLAFTGGLLALVITRMDLSVISMLGFLILSGVVVNNGIVFIDYANQLRQEGKPCREALIETGITRLRPILMTALTTILAETTMALGMGSGGDMLQGMAVVTIGGLTYATVLTLFVVPILIEIFTGKKDMTISEEDYE